MELIKKRRSVRTFNDLEIQEDLREKITLFLTSIEEKHEGKYRFPMLDIEIDGKIGTYGVIKGAHTYIGGILLEAGNLVEMGYLFEKIILYLTSLELGTCWLGGTFKRSSFASAMNLKDGERLLILTPIGFIEEKMSFKEKSMRTLAKADKRIDFDELFFNENLEPLDLYNLRDFKDALDMVRIGPSASNKQPWRIVKVDNTFHFYLKRTKDYGKNLDYDIQMLDMGIAMYHFQATLEGKDIKGKFEVLEKPREYKDFEYISTWSQEA